MLWRLPSTRQRPDFFDSFFLGWVIFPVRTSLFALTVSLLVISNPKSRRKRLEESKLMRVAFLGMGIMGRSMAANLVTAGHEVAVWNRSAGKDGEGAGSAASPADAAEGVEVMWMCVSDTKAVDDVLFGPSGVDQVLAEGMIIADSSTISPSATRRFA